MDPIIILVVVIVGIVVLKVLGALVGGRHRELEYLYASKKTMLSPAERSFYGVLRQALPDTIEILAKVRVADVMSPAKGLDRSRWQRAFNRISAKHFDFVLCGSSDFAIIAAVELDDKSHRASKRQARDTFLDQAAEHAGLTLHRIPARAAYSVSQLREQICTGLEDIGPIYPYPNEEVADRADEISPNN